MISNSVKLLGPRSKRGSIDPMALLQQSKVINDELAELLRVPVTSILDLKSTYAHLCRLYYSLAAVSRRKSIDEELRTSILAVLFKLRSSLEQALAVRLTEIPDEASVLSEASSKSFFGSSAKQGVSIRFPLMSCLPTVHCGGRCYAHDGRDRELHLIFRANLNYFVASKFEDACVSTKAQIMGRLNRAIDYGIERAIADQKSAALNGHHRPPRIRFSHIGDMARTPDFSNALAREIRLRNDAIQCVMYTRLPGANKIDPDLFVVNFSIDGGSDPRLKFAPVRSRIVCSGWNGVSTEVADVTFLEHHVEKHTVPSGSGWICPITLPKSSIRSCDEARCDVCFRHPSKDRYSNL